MTANPYITPTDPLAPYDAVLVASFGGPRSPEEVVPFLRRVSNGRIPEERLADVARHYDRFGGISPINDATDAFVNALENELRRHGVRVPVVLGNRNGTPFLEDVLPEMHSHGVRRVSPLPMPATPGAVSTARRSRLPWLMPVSLTCGSTRYPPSMKHPDSSAPMRMP